MATAPLTGSRGGVVGLYPLGTQQKVPELFLRTPALASPPERRRSCDRRPVVCSVGHSQLEPAAQHSHSPRKSHQSSCSTPVCSPYAIHSRVSTSWSSPVAATHQHLQHRQSLAPVEGSPASVSPSSPSSNLAGQQRSSFDILYGAGPAKNQRCKSSPPELKQQQENNHKAGPRHTKPRKRHPLLAKRAKMSSLSVKVAPRSSLAARSRQMKPIIKDSEVNRAKVLFFTKMAKEP